MLLLLTLLLLLVGIAIKIGWIALLATGIVWLVSVVFSVTVNYLIIWKAAGLIGIVVYVLLALTVVTVSVNNRKWLEDLYDKHFD